MAIEPVPEAAVPDLFTDGVSIATNPFGVALTFMVTEPADPLGSGRRASARAVARVRMTPDLARALAVTLAQNLPAADGPEGRR